MHMSNLTIQNNGEKEIQELRKQLTALEEKMQQLGIEKDKEEDKKTLQEAIVMSEEATAARPESSEAAAVCSCSSSNTSSAPQNGDAMDVDGDPDILDWVCLM